MSVATIGDVDQVLQQGGRRLFEQDSDVRILTLGGDVSSEVYTVEIAKSDRRGQVSLRQKGTTKVILVNQRRVLPVTVEGKAPVIESGDKYRAVCPICGAVLNVEPAADTALCPQDGQIQLYWLGVRPMTSETPTKTKHEKSEKPKAAKAKKPATPRQPKVKEPPAKIDLRQLAALSHCELWTKRQIKFDHSDWDVAAHVLIFTGTHPRKLCFNTYNGTLGKKNNALPVDDFVANRHKGDKPAWFKVEGDLDKLREKLRRQEYELHAHH